LQINTLYYLKNVLKRKQLCQEKYSFIEELLCSSYQTSRRSGLAGLPKRLGEGRLGIPMAPGGGPPDLRRAAGVRLARGHSAEHSLRAWFSGRIFM
jgi:hypothetical protein